MVLLIAFSSGRWAGVSAQDPLTPQQRRGKQIYQQGASPSGKEILAYLGESSLEVPGNAMACANCHGLDGRGKPEGGITPSDLTWETLTKPYGVVHADGRKHPPYTERALELAIKRGTDPAGNKLQNFMPRYELSTEDLGDLIAYLRRLGKDRDPGISENKIVIGSVLPARGALGEMGQAIKAVNAAFFEELNNQGGVYNRHFDLKVVETGETPAETLANVERLLKDEQVFAMTGAFVAGSEKELLSLMGQQEVPSVGPFTLYPQTGSPLNRQVFYLLSGIEGQARALVDFAAKKPELKDSRILVLYPKTELNTGVVQAVKDQSRKARLSAPQSVEYLSGHFDAAATVKQYRTDERSVVFFLGSSDEAQNFMREAEKLSWFPALFLPSSGGGGGIFAAPTGFDGKVFLSFPTSPAAQNAEGIKEFQALAEKYKLPARHVAAQISAYSADKILVEALKRAGRDLSREKLIQALEGFYEYSTGLTPAISYSPNRRIGANGAYVVTINLKAKEFVPVSEWIEIN
jgi:ABC-type branched-subunit amino acid transport system substrate-binding protein